MLMIEWNFYAYDLGITGGMNGKWKFDYEIIVICHFLILINQTF